MPIHDWSRVDAGLFHDFHQRWAVELSNVLNSRVLPSDYFALVEQNIRGPIPDVLTLRLADQGGGGVADTGGVAVEERPPQTRLTQRAIVDGYVRKASHVTVRHRHGQIVAVVEIVSPGNKSSRAEFQTLVQKSVELIRQGVHLLVIDLFPPGKRDPQGIHAAIWSEFEGAEARRPADKPLTLVAYDSGADYVAYVEFVAVGEPLPEMPLFLKPEVYVSVPLEAAYQKAWTEFPNAVKSLLEPAVGNSTGFAETE